MAEEFDRSRTEAPTQRRLQEARQQGQVAVSLELTGGVVLLAGIVVLWFGAQSLASGLLINMRLDLLGIQNSEFGPQQAQGVFISLIGQTCELVGPLVAVLFALGLLAATLQVGFHISPESLGIRWDRLSLVAGWSRLFSASSAIHGLTALLKVSLAIVLAAWLLKGRGPEIATLCEGTLSTALAQVWNIGLRLALAIAAGLVLIGAADYVVQRWRHVQSLMMSRQELKEEFRREEGDPMVRARLRKLAREAARKRMMADVPRATVIITNPTHLAIALRYDRGTMPAPRVVAKGSGYLAQRIKEIARRHAVPVVERKPVAQSLFKAVQVGQDIPAALYHAVAEVLAYVYRLRGAA